MMGRIADSLIDGKFINETLEFQFGTFMSRQKRIE
jgi:hypothetical protein